MNFWHSIRLFSCRFNRIGFAHFPYKNSCERKSGKTFEEHLINSISNSNTYKCSLPGRLVVGEPTPVSITP